MAKHLAHDYSVLMIVWLRLAVGSTIVAAHVVPKFGARVLLPHAPLLQIGRGLSSLLAMALLYRGFRSLPLAECTAIVFIAPVLANILSALFLKETGNRFSWLAAALSFVGVLIIARPGSSLYTWQALFPIGGAIALASQIALTRALDTYDDPRVTAFFGPFLGCGLLAFVLPVYWRTPDGAIDTAMFAAIGCIAAAAQILHVLAYRFGTTHEVAPFTYISVPMSIALGWWIFDASPDAGSLLGASLIVFSGLAMLRGFRPPAVTAP